ncbi:YjjG family noncanonical pyrimidine nucleotidase [Aureibaculum sp. 2210JD6-5]|uniref:YjjG family noncanonical pyrimidine nucleotidase n=1 Tax=Aureibaculum sp. 2210JD6-5 TaxID=3103957 RepID=UPI002AAD597C|nr:YjjG family noncanonical pyrimidine nucleotidase [Aureibaculum sp. 2210JD6-5]MDY7394416.1 YjjG family noncanonical pyrimidine nucleotidase [Aureibaculum sp. 2210JD6-5]
MNSNIKHVFFDLDHTLWDFETNSAQAFEFIFKESNVNINIEDFLFHYKPINFRYWKMYREERVSKKVLRYNRLKETFDLMSYKISDDHINHLSTTYIDNLPNYNVLFDGTTEILNYLLPKYKLHIITNGFEEVQTKKMKTSGILHFFDKIITSESVGVKKPNPKIFNYALQLAETDAANSIMIGDNYEADILGAQRVGMQTIHFRDCNETTCDGTINITDLLEIKQYL